MSPEQKKPSMDRAGPSLLTLVVFTFVAFNSVMAVYQSSRAMRAASFGGFSFLDLALLFYCQRLYNRTPPGSTRREHLKMAVWLLTTMLTYSAFMLLEFWFSDTMINM